MDSKAKARRAAEGAGDHPALEGLARVGYAVSGLIHLLIAWIAGQVALGGGGGGEADQGGALQQVAQAPAGAVILWIGVIGFAALALWQVLEAVVGRHGGDDKERMASRGKAAAKGGVYLALGVTTWQFASGGGSDSGETSADVTQQLMQVPGGMVLVILLGLVVVAVGVYHVYKGATKKFLEDLQGTGGGELGRGVRYAGMAGYVAKGVALVVVGGLFVFAGLQSDPEEATGLDGALKVVAEQSYGTVMLLLVALGLAAYGAYSFARARFARM